MNKPITVLYNDFSRSLISLIENSGLPAFVVRQTMTEVIDTIKQLEQQEFKRDVNAWNNYQQQLTQQKEQQEVNADE